MPGDGEGDDTVGVADVPLLVGVSLVAGVVGGVVVGGVVVGGALEDELPVGVGVPVGEEDTVSVSHCQTVVGALSALPGAFDTAGFEARACGAMATVTKTPAAVVSKTPPALRPIDPGRTRAKHM